ncbi:helix-turn-helix domain-containing protein [Flaviflagellibacter deserti]|uniref:Helix-turn-helix domain-containing protein n=1 Tax=Flaviflagellibacter deserti TaxID=2267266 RepID=A0ABV9Z368_9HYPH
MEAKRIVAWNLRRLRVAAGVSQDDLALSAGVDRGYVGRAERGSVNSTIGTLDKLAAALSVHVSEFLREPPAGESPIEPLKGGRKRSAKVD